MVSRTSGFNVESAAHASRAKTAGRARAVVRAGSRPLLSFSLWPSFLPCRAKNQMCEVPCRRGKGYSCAFAKRSSLT